MINAVLDRSKKKIGCTAESRGLTADRLPSVKCERSYFRRLHLHSFCIGDWMIARRIRRIIENGELNSAGRAGLLQNNACQNE